LQLNHLLKLKIEVGLLSMPFRDVLHWSVCGLFLQAAILALLLNMPLKMFCFSPNANSWKSLIQGHLKMASWKTFAPANISRWSKGGKGECRHSKK
jgi:hypothetical protein